MLLAFRRGDQTRTGDPYVPNVVRYQLRYTPKCFFSVITSQAIQTALCR